ncbi:MAG TPA: hypothetical protein VJY35_15530 [Candidatus Eisenbacteria bacterium]|nr:hypothetical protein [Candidatus Eisenbacteria bacterium]
MRPPLRLRENVATVRATMTLNPGSYASQFVACQAFDVIELAHDGTMVTVHTFQPGTYRIVRGRVIPC